MSSVPLPFMFPHAIAFWVAYVWAFYVSEWNMIRGSKAELPSATAPRQDSLRWLTSVALVAQLGAFGAAFWAPAQFPERATEPMFWCGIALLLGGSMLRRHCFRMLGRNFTIDVRVSAAQSVVDRGAYAYVRHPGYTAAIAMLIGVGLALGSYISLTVITAMALFVYMRRIEFEERALVEVLGENYLAYAKGRRRLIPYVY
jgi:protein-S-isoprenylcysteine O-methyltransferase